jgi:hypothetical protein
LAFAQTVALSVDSLPKIEPSPAPAPTRAPSGMTGSEHDEVTATASPDLVMAPTALEEPEPNIPMAAGVPLPLSSLWSRLNAKPKWQRNAWIGISIAMSVVVGALGATRLGKRTPASSKTEPQHAAPLPAALPPSPPPVAPLPSPPPVDLAAAPAPSPAESPSTQDPSPAEPIQPGFGHLTVHSTGSQASVYVMLKKYGAVEEKLAIPCGKRFIAIGVPVRDQKEPTWLAPGKSTIIPCGGSLELTMNPRRLK